MAQPKNRKPMGPPGHGGGMAPGEKAKDFKGLQGGLSSSCKHFDG